MFTFFTACFLAWMGKPEAVSGVLIPTACCRLAGGGTRRVMQESLTLSPKLSLQKLRISRQLVQGDRVSQSAFQYFR